MLFHASLPARDPENAARVLGELWRTAPRPFPPVPGGWIVFAGDGRGTCLEVWPARGEPARPNPVHLALGVPLDESGILDVAARAGWPARRAGRGAFDVVELWVEGHFLLELLTPAMQADYAARVGPEMWGR